VSLSAEALGGSTYTAEQSVETGENPGEGSTTFNIEDSISGESAGSMTINAGNNVTITEIKDGDKSIAVINATDTTYEISSAAGEECSNVVKSGIWDEGSPNGPQPPVAGAN